MGYSITIGEGRINVYTEDNYVEIGVKNISLPNAPSFGEPTDKMNTRWPSYSAWANFCKFVGLYDLFFDKECGIMSKHPGTFPLTSEHQRIINDAFHNFKLKYPKSVAGYRPRDFEGQWPECNSYLVRLEWLKFWVDYSIKNIEEPLIHNS